MAIMPSLTGIATAMRKHGIDPTNVPADNGIFLDGYLTLHEIRTMREPLVPGTEGMNTYGGIQHEFHKWPTDEARVEILRAYGMEVQ